MNRVVECRESHSRGWESLEYIKPQSISKGSQEGWDGDRLQVTAETRYGEQQTQPCDLRDLP